NREEDSLRWAAEIASRFPDDRWQEFILAAVNNRVTRFIREGKTNEARNFLEIYKTNILYANYSQLDSIITDAELLRSANQILAAADGDAVVNAIVNARSSGKITERRAAELITFAVQKSAAILCAAPARDWRAAIRYIENALSRFGANRELEQALRTYRNNLAVEYHNRFAAEWNNRNYEAAERILNEGLAEFPADRQLLANRDIVIRHNSR
ncbi:MAG: hypothetical protein LBI12_08100, partial [Treponema sp.]|nr:hypothetical protein [Treponema sp.]